MIFEDFRTVPPLNSLAWSVYALVANSYIKTAEALAAGLGDLDELPASRVIKLKNSVETDFGFRLMYG